MAKLTQFISNISALQTIQILRFSTLFCIGVVFAHYYNTNIVGTYETFIFIAGAISFFWLQGLIQTFLSVHDSTSKPSIYFNVFLLITTLSILSAIFLKVYSLSLSFNQSPQSQPPYVNYLVLYLVFSTPATLTEYIYVAKNKAKNLLLYGFVSFTLHFIAVIAPAIFKLDMEYSILALVGINILRFLWLVALLLKYSSAELDLQFIKKYLQTALPLIGSILLSGSAQYIDGLIITKYYDDATFAIFRYGARELPLALILSNALNNVMVANFSNFPLQESLNKIKKESLKLMHILYPVTLISIPITPWLFETLFSPEFAFSAYIYNVYLLLIISRIIFPQSILVGSQQTRPIFWTSLIEICVNISLSLLFIHYFGLIGVAYATVIAFYLEKIILSIHVKVKLNIQLRQYLNLKWYTIYTCALVILFLITNYFII